LSIDFTLIRAVSRGLDSGEGDIDGATVLFRPRKLLLIVGRPVPASLLNKS